MATVTKEQIATAWHHGKRLRLSLAWRQDRYQTELFLDEESSSTLLLSSVEGSAQDRWPASPPLQSLALESRGEQTVALAVGMAGKAHWSASIETLPEPLALRFDYACRLSEPAEFLGSTFEPAQTNSGLFELAFRDIQGGRLTQETNCIAISAEPPVQAGSVWKARWQFTIWGRSKR